MATQKKIKSDNSGKNIPSPLDAEEMELICRRLIEYLETSKRYLDPELSLWQLSRETGIPTKKISKSINSYMGCNFFDFLNRIRVEEAKRLLKAKAAKGLKMPIADIGEQSGFSTRSVFFARFAEFEGLTPAKYIKLYCGDKRPENTAKDNDTKKNQIMMSN